MEVDVLHDTDGIYKIYADPIAKKFVKIDDSFFPSEHYQTGSFLSLDRVQSSPLFNLYLPIGTEIKLNIIEKYQKPPERLAEPVTEDDLKVHAPREYQHLKEKGQLPLFTQEQLQEVSTAVQNQTAGAVVSEIHNAISKKKEENLIKVQKELMRQVKYLYSLKGKSTQDKFKENIKCFAKGITFVRPELQNDVDQFVKEMLQ